MLKLCIKILLDDLMDCTVLSSYTHVQLFVPRWTIAHQAPLSMGFSRQEYWCGLPFLLGGPVLP